MTVGVAGFPMARNGFIAQRLLNAGHRVVVFGEGADTERLVARGARPAATARELARCCETIFCCALSSQEIEQLLTSEDGLLAGAGAGTVLFDVTIMPPLTARRLGGLAAQTGVHYLETPASGGHRSAVETMSMIVSGDEAVFARHRKVLDDVAQPVTYVGAKGAASVIKLLNELLIMGFGAIVDEALTLASLAGIAGETLRQALLTMVAAPLVEAADGSPLGWRVPHSALPLGMAAKLNRDFTPDGSLTVATQVLMDLAALADASNFPAPMSTATAGVYRRALEAGLPDVAAATLLLRERLAGLGSTVIDGQ